MYYEIACSGPTRSEVSIDRVGPIRVPLRDVAHLEVGHIGQFVTMANMREGVLLQARTEEGVQVNWRGFPVADPRAGAAAEKR